jgi:hypothetical protein
MDKSETAAPSMKSMKPSTRFDVSVGIDMPKIGDMVECHVLGKVIRTEAGINRYGDGKKQGMIEVEHDLNAVKVSKAGRRSLKEVEDADEAV